MNSAGPIAISATVTLVVFGLFGPVDWPVVADPGSRTALAYGVYGIPETFVIGPDGRVTAKHVGPVTYDQLVREITRVLPGGSR